VWLPLRSSLFPYTTLFRSVREDGERLVLAGIGVAVTEERSPDVARLRLLPDLGRYLEHLVLHELLLIEVWTVRVLEIAVRVPVLDRLVPRCEVGIVLG